MYTIKDLTKDIYQPKEVAKILNVHYSTLVRWDTDVTQSPLGRVIFGRTKTNRRFITKATLIELLKASNMFKDEVDEDSRSDVIYARVSSHEQKTKGDLDRQVSFLVQNAGDLSSPIVLTEVGSGLNDNRKQLAKLIDLVMSGRVKRVFVTYKDRLTRFGYRYLEKSFNSQGVEIIAIQQQESKQSVDDELVSDMMSLIASFSGKLYGRRSRKNKVAQ